MTSAKRVSASALGAASAAATRARRAAAIDFHRGLSAWGGAIHRGMRAPRSPALETAGIHQGDVGVPQCAGDNVAIAKLATAGLRIFGKDKRDLLMNPSDGLTQHGDGRGSCRRSANAFCGLRDDRRN